PGAAACCPDPESRPCTSRCPHGARAGHRRVARSLARHRGAAWHAARRHRSPRRGDPAHDRVARVPEECRERRRAASLPPGGAVRRAYFEGGRGAVAPDEADWSEEDAVAGAFFGTFAARCLSFVASATS